MAHSENAVCHTSSTRRMERRVKQKQNSACRMLYSIYADDGALSLSLEAALAVAGCGRESCMQHVYI
jgi:hypothetical protein